MSINTNTLDIRHTIWSWIARNLTNNVSFKAYFEPLIQLFFPQWRADRFRSSVIDVRRESDDMYSLVIKPNKQWKGFRAGQYIELTVEKEGAWVSRFFSISSSPRYFNDSGLIEISIRIQENGQITPWLPQALKAGGVVNLSQAEGEFCLADSTTISGVTASTPTTKPILMIAGGSGITPFRSMLQQISLNGLAVSKPVSLMYYARSPEHFLFKEALNTYQQQVPNLTVNFIDTNELGFFSDAHLLKYCDDFAIRDIYICGPSPMIMHARKVLQNQNVNQEQIHYEFFGPEPVSLEGSGQASSVLFQQSGKQVTTNKDEPKTLLTLAEDAQLKPLSGCRIGVCHQCICQKKSGVVYNSKTKTYSDTGQEEIQLCVSVPVADVVLAL
ncbi:ferredoxin reductase [Alkalimarinus alittae]|uniref:FAD-binding oxidoreductase n=1 Tax=Alkalimarinus alittae TaxID=2961619 RepID=A0ABY6N2N6_9ALTE|nr:ferredoxin reductase [Alkalimarinus alittae]UZE96346.1 FAD-binding oxidoreductase [Alkalimarinus alittae]